MSGRALSIGFLLAALFTAQATAAAADPPGRIVSLNLCTDQYLLALADREQIAGVTQLAADPGMSAAAGLARGLPAIGGAAEEVIALDPDLVVGGTFSRRATLGMLERLGYRVVAVPPAESVAAVRDTARELAKAVGHPERGERLVAALDRALDAVGPDAGEGRPTALYYQRRGFANGSKSLVSEIMTAAGLRNLAGDLGLEHTGRVELEAVVAARPDYLLVDSRSPRLEDQGSYMLRHPALLRAVPADRRLLLPRSLIICGGPMTAGAILHLAGEVRSAE